MLTAERLPERWPARLALFVLLVLCVPFTISAIPLVTAGGPDIGSLMLGIPDEFEIARGIYWMLRDKTLDYHIPAYPGAYPNLAAFFLGPIQRVIGLTEWHTALGLRWFSLVFGVLSICSTFWLTWLISRSNVAATIAAGFLVLTPELRSWSVRIHPDTLLWFELTLALGAMVLALRERSQRWLTISFVLAGVATMTKLVGLYLIPWIVLAQLYLDKTGSPTPKRDFGRHLVKGFFLLAFVAYVTTPMLLVDSKGFYNNVLSIRKEMMSGLQTNFHPVLGWLQILVDPRLGGYTGTALLVLFFLSFTPWLIRLVREPRQAVAVLGTPALDALPIGLFAGGYLLHLAISIRDYQLRYAAAVLPCIAVAVGLTAGGFWPQLPRAWEWLRSRPRSLHRLPLLIFLLAFLAEIAPRLDALAKDAWGLSTREFDPRIEVGQWLEQVASPDAHIIYDYNVYIPLKFKNARVTYGLVESQVKGFRPEYVLIFDARRDHFRDPDAVKGDPKEVFYHRERVRTLALLEQDALLNLRKIRRFERAHITVFHDSTAEQARDVATKPP